MKAKISLEVKVIFGRRLAEISAPREGARSSDVLKGRRPTTCHLEALLQHVRAAAAGVCAHAVQLHAVEQLDCNHQP